MRPAGDVATRVIPCLDVDGGRVVKGVNFKELRDAGDPVELARTYDAEGADELTFLDVTASSGNRETTYDIVRRKEKLFKSWEARGNFTNPTDREQGISLARKMGEVPHLKCGHFSGNLWHQLLPIIQPTKENVTPRIGSHKVA